MCATVADRHRRLRFSRVPAPALHVQLECELPSDVAVGVGTALFVCGWCFCRSGGSLGSSSCSTATRSRWTAHGMPRLDPFRAMHPTLDPFATAGAQADPQSDEDPELHGYRTGFWGVITIAPGSCGRRVRAGPAGRARDRRDRRGLPGHPRAARGRSPRAAALAGARGRPAGRDRMATYDPPPDLLARQLESIRAQTHDELGLRDQRRLLAPEQSLATLEAAIAGDRASSSRARRGGSASTATSSARWRWSRRDAQFVALCRPGRRLAPGQARGAARQRSATRQLVYSDARVVARDGERDLRHLLGPPAQQPHRPAVAAGGQLGDRRGVAVAARAARRTRCRSRRRSSPTSTTTGSALVALALGEIAFVPRPLYDYVQHGDASLGHAARQPDALAARPAAPHRRRRARARPHVAAALLRRRLPADAVRDGPADCAAGTG